MPFNNCKEQVAQAETWRFHVPALKNYYSYPGVEFKEAYKRLGTFLETMYGYKLCKPNCGTTYLITPNSYLRVTWERA